MTTRGSRGFEGGRHEPAAASQGRQPSLRSRASRPARRAPRLSYFGVAALPDPEGPVAHPHQCLRYFLRSGRQDEAGRAGPERGSESEARRSLCRQAHAAAFGDQRRHEVAHLPGSAGCGRIRFCSPGAASSRAFMTLNHPQQELQKRARALARETIAPRAAGVDRTEQYPWENVTALNDAGFFGMTIPKAYGGPGLGFLDSCLVVDEVAQVCGVSGRIVGEANMGAISAGRHYGGRPQKKHARGVGVTGSAETEILFRDMEGGDDMVVLPPSGFRRGFADLMNAYNSQRVGAATVALGLADGAYQHALDYANSRNQFGRPIAEFQGLQWMLADMSVQISAARELILKAARSSSPFPDPLFAAQAKIFAADAAIKVTNDALQVFGAAGYSRNRPLERMVLDTRMFTIS